MNRQNTFRYQHHLLRDSRRKLSMKKIIFYLITELFFNQKLMRLRTKRQLRNDANMETLQPNNQNDMVAINNNYKVSKNEHTTNDNKNN